MATHSSDFLLEPMPFPYSLDTLGSSSNLLLEYTTVFRIIALRVQSHRVTSSFKALKKVLFYYFSNECISSTRDQKI